ncbi:MAG: GAF domain-containing protein [Candidatus Binataceae bacterium]|nr:GAF domain-containing protein [Candidatus Binataceae bacterium]
MGQALDQQGDSDRIYAVVENGEITAKSEGVSASWCRSLGEHKVDPDNPRAPWVLTEAELKDASGPVEELIGIARQENDRLYSIVGKVGYVVMLTSPDGVVVDFRGDPARSRDFAYWGVWKGGVWSEAVEGTNGIGTCIAELRPVTVHRTQHFRARNGSLSCCGAPIFDPGGELAAVLDVSSIDPEISERSHSLALAVTIDSARAVEESLFRSSFRQAWTLAIAAPSADGRALMLAVDADQRIVGADRTARRTLGIDSALLAAGASLWTFFERSLSFFRARNASTAVLLRRIGEHEPWPALSAPPETDARGTPLPASAALPRTDAPLSPREQSILDFIGRGQTNKEIARLLGISPETVKSHVKNMFWKLGVERRAQAIRRAKDFG